MPDKTRFKTRFSYWLWLALLLVTAGIGVVYFIPGSTPPITDAQGRPVPGSIASLEKVKLGGVDQWLLIRGHDASKPVILFVHGGPGTAEMAVLRGSTRELEKHFVVVIWDQRGAGKSHAAIRPNSAMNISQFVADTRDLTELLRQRFHQNKIYLAGHSWGTVLGVLAVSQYPDQYFAYIGISQVVNMQENERLSYEWTLAQAEQAKDLKTIAKLKKIGPPPYTGDWLAKTITERQLLGKFGGEAYGSSLGAIPMFLKALWKSREYSLTDKVNFFRGPVNSMRLLWPELLTINFMEQVPKLQVPVYLMIGRHDYETPQPLAEQYFKVLQAPHKELIWFENSAHLPNLEEPDKFNRILIEQILPATWAK
jgi:pimeloyl-ACP methyl ester carboxylesterase